MLLKIGNKINITICGMMGSGKSSIGKLIAKKINYNFIDTDILIEKKENKSINQIFAENGEEYFRALEKKITLNYLNNKKTIISLGGGAILNKDIRLAIKLNSFNIYLKSNKFVLKKRLESSKSRPLLKNVILDEKLDELLNQREKFYNNADLIINNDKKISNTINEILKFISYK